MEEEITRQEAKVIGQNWYFTGKPCKNGHVSRRQVSNKGCLICIKARLKEWQSKNLEKMRGYSKKFYNENREELCKKSREWSRDNPEKVTIKKLLYRKQSALQEKRRRELYPQKVHAQQVKYRQNNREKICESSRWWRARNPEKARAVTLNNRAKRALAEGVHTGQDIKEILIKQRFLCAICSLSIHRLPFHVDHIIPISRGGSNWPENLQCTCPACNLQKSNSLPSSVLSEP